VGRIASQSWTLALYRPVGPRELALIEASGLRSFHLAWRNSQSFPVLSEEYAIQIARDWNATRDGAGYVTCFKVTADFVRRYQIQMAGSSMHQELWVPAEELSDFNGHIVGLIEVIASF
jgi:hypothetical protein